MLVYAGNASLIPAYLFSLFIQVQTAVRCPPREQETYADVKFNSEETEVVMYVPLAPAPLAALIAGILILAMPRLLNLIVALYLIAIGLLGLLAR